MNWVNLGATALVPVFMGEPGVWLLHGRLITTIDAGGNVTSRTFIGSSINLCRKLAELSA